MQTVARRGPPPLRETVHIVHETQGKKLIASALGAAAVGLCAFGSAGFIAPATAVADLPPPGPDPVPTGGDPRFAGWAQSCHDGSMTDCDRLRVESDIAFFYRTASDPDATMQYNMYGTSCGGRTPVPPYFFGAPAYVPPGGRTTCVALFPG